MPAVNSSLSTHHSAFDRPVGSELRLVSPPHKLDLSGPVVGARYRLLQPQSETASNTIYEAEDLDNGRRVVIRVLREPEGGAMGLRYLAETRAATGLCHPNIIDIIDFGRDIIGDGEPVAYLVMAHLEGESLEETLALDGPMHWTKVVTIAKQICLALIAAHEQCIVHCNVSLANCFRVMSDGAPDVIKLLDFGGASFACKRTGRCTAEPRNGESGSLAPELLAGESFDCRVDIFALGLLMYRLTTHRMPYVQGTRAGDLGSPNTTVPFEVAPAFEAVVLKALALDPAQRHASAQAMYDALVVAEQASRPPSRLAEDPLHWAHEGRREVVLYQGVLSAANDEPESAGLQGSDAEASSPRWSPALSRTVVVAVALVVLVATTTALQTAWNLLT